MNISWKVTQITKQLANLSPAPGQPQGQVPVWVVVYQVVGTTEPEGATSGQFTLRYTSAPACDVGQVLTTPPPA